MVKCKVCKRNMTLLVVEEIYRYFVPRKEDSNYEQDGDDESKDGECLFFCENPNCSEWDKRIPFDAVAENFEFMDLGNQIITCRERQIKQ